MPSLLGTILGDYWPSVFYVQTLLCSLYTVKTLGGYSRTALAQVWLIRYMYTRLCNNDYINLQVLIFITFFFQRVFKPGMPDDVVAYFCVNSDKLVLSIYTLTTLPVPPQNSVSLFQHCISITTVEPPVKDHPKCQA